MRNSCGAEKILKVIKHQLADFGINSMQASIVSIVSDGAFAMKRFGKVSKGNYQLCYAHGMRLSVYDVFTKVVVLFILRLQITIIMRKMMKTRKYLKKVLLHQSQNPTMHLFLILRYRMHLKKCKNWLKHFEKAW